MKRDLMPLCLLLAALFATDAGAGKTAPTTAAPATDTSGGAATGSESAMAAGRVAAPFGTLAGSADNAVALASALRTGTPATLTTISTDASGATVTTTTTITPPTKPMGWGNVSHSLELSQFALTHAGVTQPTPADLQAALMGGSVTGADGTTVTLAGVLKQRAAGMGWGTIAKSYGTTVGAVTRSENATVRTSTATTTAAAGGTTKGIVSASSRPVGSTAVISAGGGSNPAGRGIVTAAGAGVTGGAASQRHGGGGVIVTAAGSPGSGITTARGDNGTHGQGQGKGRDGG